MVVHRLLACALGLSPLPEYFRSAEWIAAAVENMNLRHRNARLAGRASTELYTVEFFKDNPQVSDARVVRVKGNGLLAFVPKYGIEGAVYLAAKARFCVVEGGQEGGQGRG